MLLATPLTTGMTLGEQLVFGISLCGTIGTCFSIFVKLQITLANLKKDQANQQLIVHELREEIKELKNFHQTQNSKVDKAVGDIRVLVERLLTLNGINIHKQNNNNSHDF